MAYEQNDMSGSLFKNNKRETDRHPNYTGSALVDGVPMWLSAWVKQDRNGNSYMSLAFKRKDAPVAGQADKRPAKDDMDDSIPF